MTTQLLIRYDDFDQAAFDADAEARSQAGLSLLQLWTETDGASRWALFSVNDKARAQSWLDKEAALGHPPSASHVLTTA